MASTPGRPDVKVRRPRPKQLDSTPVLHDPAGGGALAGSISVRAAGRGGAGAASGAGGSFGGDEDGALAATQTTERDPSIHADARRLAARLRLATPPHDQRRRSTFGRIAPIRGVGAVGDIDLDRTLEHLVSLDDARDDDLVLRARRQRLRSVVLVVDVSGSMRGERLRMAAATVGAVVARLREEEVGVVAFWSDAAIVRRLTRRLDAVTLVDELAAIPARGLTNVAFGLQSAAQVLREARGERRVLMISDCVHNAGPDPVSVARCMPRLDVLVDVSGEHDLDVARSVARAGRGMALPVRGHRDVVAAVGRCFTDRTGAVRR